MSTNHFAQLKLFNTAQTAATSDDYYTPPEVFNNLNMKFDLDVCAPPGGIPWIPANRYLTQEEDGLICEWYGTVWLNPPFSNPTPWVQKFKQHNNGVGLVPQSNGNWLTELWNSEICFVLPKPIKFYNANGSLPASIPTRCFLIATKQWSDKLKQFGQVR